ncbi:hypothetical protein A5702_01435 [Mycobacterium sp. E3339]|nr:hypothetical protein A5702_01435 [Mycobacterium sp. E3339]
MDGFDDSVEEFAFHPMQDREILHKQRQLLFVAAQRTADFTENLDQVDLVGHGHMFLSRGQNFVDHRDGCILVVGQCREFPQQIPRAFAGVTDLFESQGEI